MRGWGVRGWGMRRWEGEEMGGERVKSLKGYQKELRSFHSPPHPSPPFPTPALCSQVADDPLHRH